MTLENFSSQVPLFPQAEINAHCLCRLLSVTTRLKLNLRENYAANLVTELICVLQ